MVKSRESKGRCLCGEVEIHARNMSLHVGACHCDMCRKWGGGPYMEVDCGSEVAFTGEKHITVYSSSEWAERGFCAVCGTHLFYRLKHSQEHMVPVGLFDAVEGLHFDNQVFIDEKPAFYSFANATKNMTGPEVFAQFATSSE